MLASTDYDMDQAEVVKVVRCSGHKCVVSGGVKYPHHGREDSGVDMRGEVGILIYI